MVFGIWLPLLLVFNTVSGFMGIDYHTDFTLPNSDSQFVKDALIKTGDIEDAGYTAQIVFASTDFIDDATRLRIKNLMEPFFAEVDKIDGVKVVSPYTDKGRRLQQQAQGHLVRPDLLHRPQRGGHSQPWPSASSISATRWCHPTHGTSDAIRNGRTSRACCASSTAANCSPGSTCPRARSSACWRRSSSC